MADKYSPIKDTNGKDFSPKFFETEGKMGRFQKAIHWITSYLEMALTILLIVGILASFIHVPELLGNILSENYSFLLNLVNYVATIIIAIELIHVLNSQNLESVIEILCAGRAVSSSATSPRMANTVRSRRLPTSCST